VTETTSGAGSPIEEPKEDFLLPTEPQLCFRSSSYPHRCAISLYFKALCFNNAFFSFSLSIFSFFRRVLGSGCFGSFNSCFDVFNQGFRRQCHNERHGLNAQTDAVELEFRINPKPSTKTQRQPLCKLAVGKQIEPWTRKQAGRVGTESK
jgi:hypothetical protein